MADFKQVLVHLDASKTAAARLHVARDIAGHTGAAVTALYAVVPAYLDAIYVPDLAPGLVEGLAEIDASRLTDARGAFDDEMKLEGPLAAWSEATDMPVVDAFVQQAFHADLLVLGQENPLSPAPGVPLEFPQSVILASGKPTLLIPHVGWNRGVGDTVVIAWKQTRESARAVTAALPLLRRARNKIHVLAWGKSCESPIRGQRLDLRSFLHLHGVNVQWHAGDSEPKMIGEALLSHAFDLEADLLVMGCYGHSRARELVMGGASRTVLRSMTLPVLMAH